MLSGMVVTYDFFIGAASSPCLNTCRVRIITIVHLALIRLRAIEQFTIFCSFSRFFTIFTQNLHVSFFIEFSLFFSKTGRKIRSQKRPLNRLFDVYPCPDTSFIEIPLFGFLGPLYRKWGFLLIFLPQFLDLLSCFRVCSIRFSL